VAQDDERTLTETSASTVALSLFFPMYNEQGNIEHAVASALAVLAGVTDRYEVIVVDDGSRDSTGALADRLAAANPHVRAVHHPENRGYGSAVRSGLAAARYPLVVLADGDNQFDLGELSVLLRGLGTSDIVSGYRITPRDPALRRLYAFVYNRVARLLFRIRVRDVNCGFKVYRRALVEQLLPELRSTGALINIEILARARQRGAKVTEVGVHHYARETGQPTGGNPAVIVRAAREMMELWRELR
jgi:glycosyltransferase involved in cell wall biosynthesis